MSQKKCPACAQWSNWNQDMNDKCEHCGMVLEHQRAADTRKREEKARRPLTFTRRKIEPGDSMVQMLYKSIFNWTGAAYFGFLSFMMWLIAVVVH
jgi:hypothetical protein